MSRIELVDISKFPIDWTQIDPEIAERIIQEMNESLPAQVAELEKKIEEKKEEKDGVPVERISPANGNLPQLEVRPDSE
jgi:DNA-binding transcriptional MerR regulator